MFILRLNSYVSLGLSTSCNARGLATYDKDTFYNMSVMKLTFKIQENMLILNESF